MGKKENTNYFPHDSNARNSDKLIRLRMRHKAAGYGVYFMILERLREEPNYMSVKDYNMIAFDLREDASLIKSVIEDFGLFVFTEDGKYFYSESFMRRMAIKDNKSKVRSEAGKKGMERRWEEQRKSVESYDITKSPKTITKHTENDNNAITKHTENDNNAITKHTENDNKESKEKESKLKKVSSNEDKKETPPEKSPYVNFKEWMKANTPNVLKLQKQVTEEQYRKIREKYSYQQLVDILLAMENYKDLPKKYTSVYLTFLKWAKKEYGTD